MNRFILLLAVLALTASCNNSGAEQRVHKLLTDRMQTLATAESCTGGSIATRFTAQPGASAYYKGGVVAYWNHAKKQLLDISHDTIAHYGVVSEQIARKMAENIRTETGTHYSIASTGIAGPTGGTPEFPVGSVWIAISSPERTVSQLIHIKGNRRKVIREAGTAAIVLLEKEIMREKVIRYHN